MLAAVLTRGSRRRSSWCSARRGSDIRSSRFAERLEAELAASKIPKAKRLSDQTLFVRCVLVAAGLPRKTAENATRALTQRLPQPRPHFEGTGNEHWLPMKQRQASCAGTPTLSAHLDR